MKRRENERVQNRGRRMREGWREEGSRMTSNVEMKKARIDMILFLHYHLDIFYKN